MTDAPPHHTPDTLSPDELYVVTELRTKSPPMLKFDPNGRPLVWSGPIPVCTYDTLFRLLGKGVLILDPEARRMDQYLLAEDWR